MTVLLLVDMSASGRFGFNGTGEARAGGRAGRCSPFPPSATMTAFGLIIFTEKVERFVPAKRQEGTSCVSSAKSVLRNRSQPHQPGTGARFPGAHRPSTRGRVLGFDFLAPPEQYERSLRSQPGGMIWCRGVTDPLEEQLPRVGLLEVQIRKVGEVGGVRHIRARSESLADQNRAARRRARACSPPVSRRHRGADRIAPTCRPDQFLRGAGAEVAALIEWIRGRLLAAVPPDAGGQRRLRSRARWQPRRAPTRPR